MQFCEFSAGLSTNLQNSFSNPCFEGAWATAGVISQPVTCLQTQGPKFGSPEPMWFFFHFVCFVLSCLGKKMQGRKKGRGSLVWRYRGGVEWLPVIFWPF